jgi:hypothetical protein
MSLFVIRAFIKMREQLATDTAILKRLAEIDKTLLVHDSALHDLYHRLLPFVSPTARAVPPQNWFSPVLSPESQACWPRHRFRRRAAPSCHVVAFSEDRKPSCVSRFGVCHSAIRIPHSAILQPFARHQKKRPAFPAERFSFTQRMR